LTDSARPTLIQALGDKRLMAVLLLSFASGLPYNLTGFTVQAWLASEGLDIKTIGIFTLVSLPYLFKFLWAPLLDRYLPPILGRRRGWILIYQLCLSVAIGFMASVPHQRSVRFGRRRGSRGNTFRVSGYCDRRVSRRYHSRERARTCRCGSVFRLPDGCNAGGRSAGSDRRALGLALAFLMVACLMAATTLGTLWAPEPEVPGQPPRTLIDAVWHPLRALFSQKGAWGFLLLVLLYKVGDAFALSLYSAFMIKGVGFSLDELSIAGKVNMTVSSMIGVAFGGWVYMRWGTFKSLLVFGIGQALTNLLYVWLALAGKKVWLLVLATSLDTGVGGMGLAAFVAFLVSLCSANFSATQYALLSALASIPSKVMGYVAGIVVSHIGWANFFVVTCVTAVPGLILLVILRVPLNELAARETAQR